MLSEWNSFICRGLTVHVGGSGERAESSEEGRRGQMAQLRQRIPSNSKAAFGQA